MKKVRNVLAAFAFIFAIGASFASVTMNVTAQSRQKVDADQGNLITGTCEASSASINCDTSSSNLCDIATGQQFWRYFEDASCNDPYKRQ